MKYKKIFKIVLINLLILSVLLSFLEIYSYNKLKAKNSQFLVGFNKLMGKSADTSKLKYGWMRKFDYIGAKSDFRPTRFGNNLSRPIMFFGCSFMYGFGLDETQTLSYKISELTKRTVYNRASCAWGTQHVLYQLRRDDLKKEVPDAEYIVYTFIYHHLDRLYAYNIADFSFQAMLRYQNKNGKLSEVNPAFLPLYSLFSVRYLQDTITDLRNSNDDDLIFMFNSVMNESLTLAHKKYPNSKFVLLIYKEARDITESRQNKFKEQLSVLKKNGLIVVDAEDLVGHDFNNQKYLTKDNWHPSEKAWDEIAPKLVEYLKL